jgi:hypothetical protein
MWDVVGIDAPRAASAQWGVMIGCSQSRLLSIHWRDRISDESSSFESVQWMNAHSCVVTFIQMSYSAR